MPRLFGGSQSQSYVIGGGSNNSAPDRGSELPRFERPVLKQAKSAYSSTSPRLQSLKDLTPSSRSALPFFRGRSPAGRASSADDLPLTNPNPPTSGNSPSSNSSNNGKPRSKMRAAVSGRDSVLPDWSRATPSPSGSFNRSRTNSTPDASGELASNNNYPSQHSRSDYDTDEDDPQTHQLSMMETQQSSQPHNRALRHRKPMEDYQSSTSTRPPRQPSRAYEESPYRLSRSRKTMRFQKLMMRLNCGHAVQAVIILFVTFLLYDAHHKSNVIAQRLQEFKSEEAMVFLHLHRIEQQSIQLHESLERLDANGAQGGDNSNAKDKDNGDYVNTNDKHAPSVDAALIEKNIQQLMQMEQELSDEVRTLQTRIQHSAVRSIVHEYGEGPVQVIFEVMVDGQPSKISILLWHDTPHAAWTWLEQISRRLWDGAKINLENSRIMSIAAPRPDKASRLDFIERSQQKHEAWTVGLADSPGEGLEIFINLQDNTEFSKHNVCVGKVFDGFDVLHKLVERSRNVQQSGGEPITIRSARASHLTNRETKGLI